MRDRSRARIDFDGSFAPRPFSADNKITLEDGFLSGEVEGRVNATWHDHHLDGCKYDDERREDPLHRRHAQRGPRSPTGRGVSFSVRQGANPGEAKLTWALDDP